MNQQLKTKILIVDDLKENILALSQLILSDDVELFTATTPDEALNHVLDNDFGLALLDVQMPVMSGFELARLIRGVERSRHLPVIFVTAHSRDTNTIFEGYESGAVDVLFKPLDPHIVRSKVNVFVRLDLQSRQLAAQVSTMAHLKEEAESANVAKSRFLANMSHEIRTPLSAVLGFADVLSQSELSDKEKVECLASISRNGKLLLRIIDDILDLSRIEAQRLELEKMTFSIEELMHDLELTLSIKAADKGIALNFKAAPGFGGRYSSDPLRIKQVLLNLVSNSIKFTHHGGITVTSESRVVRPLTAQKSAEHELRFIVEDTGIGLSPEEAQRVFEPFAQADSSTRRKYGGTGLGLAISRQLARSLGGDVKILHSEKDKGSIFELTIRAEPAGPEMTKGASPVNRVGGEQELATTNAPARQPTVPQNLGGKKVLVVDDVVDNRTLIERYLKPVGIEVGLANGGVEALEHARLKDWDVVLMDIQMPNMDGYEVTAKLREMGFKKPIIALTAHAMREELDRCLRAGCDSTLTKPVAKKELLARLSEVIV